MRVRPLSNFFPPAPIPVLLLFFLFTFFLWSPSNASSDLTATRLITSEKSVGEYGHRRWLASGGNTNTTTLLAESRTHRKDPLDDFKYYTGGWNISDRHYWASVGFTAAPFFVIAAAWFVIFGVALICICLCYCCCRRKSYGYSRTCYALSLVFLVLFTIAAIVGSAFLYTGQHKFDKSTSETLDYVIGEAEATAKNLTDLSEYLHSAKNIVVGPSSRQFSLTEDLKSKIDSIQEKISSASSTLSSKTHDNSKKIRNALNYVRIALIVVASVMLFLAFIGFLLSVFGVQCLVYTLVVVGWILVAVTFILCGIFLLLHNVVADTCVAMDEWVENPKAQTALDDILPCVDSSTAQDILNKSKEVTHELVGVIDNFIVNVTNRNFPSNAAPLYYNQSGPLIPLLCNPYSENLSDRTTCKTGQVGFDNATEVWKNYVCQVSAVDSGNNNNNKQEEEICTTTGRLTPSYYEQLIAGSNMSYGIYHYSPFLVDLADCSFVRRTFSDISKDYCPSLQDYTKWIYIGLVLVSSGVMLSLIFWVVYARERRHRVYTKKMDAQQAGSRPPPINNNNNPTNQDSVPLVQQRPN